jgi:hypothetical protein
VVEGMLEQKYHIHHPGIYYAPDSPQKRLPIIDQHNFRAMNNLILAIRPGFSFKKNLLTGKTFKTCKFHDLDMRSVQGHFILRSG